MKDTIELIVDKYGMGSLRYSLIPYSDTANINIKFSETYPSIEDLKAAIQAMLPVTGGSNLTEALSAAKEAFEDSGVRKDAIHVLVVITDKTSGASEDAIKKAAKPLQESGIVVIPVGIGNQVSTKELEGTTDNEENVITVGVEEDPKNLMEMIMTIINGMILSDFIGGFRLSVRSNVFTELKTTRQLIN